MRLQPRSVAGGEAVERAGTAGAHQRVLAATRALVREVPAGRPVVVQRTGAVVVPDDRRAVAAAGPGLAGGVGLRRERGAVGTRAGQDVVLVGRVAAALDDA